MAESTGRSRAYVTGASLVAGAGSGCMGVAVGFPLGEKAGLCFFFGVCLQVFWFRDVTSADADPTATCKSATSRFNG